MTTEQIKKAVANFETQKFEHIVSLCQSPIEVKFITNFYYFFHKNGFPISLEFIRPDDVENWEDDKLKGLWTYWKKSGDRSSLTKTIIVDPLMKEKSILCGFSIICIDVIYRIIPQLPIYDEHQIRFADFVFEVRSYEGKHLKDFIIECDGFAYHGSRQQINNDNVRTRFLAGHGYTVIRYSSSEIENLSEDLFIKLENNIYHSIFKKNSNLYKIKTM